MNAQRRSVNLVPGMSAPAVLHASEGDVGRVLEIVIIDGQLVYNIPSTATVTITATKPSGMGFTQACTVTENGTATFETTASMTDESGKMEAEVRIVDGGKNIGTANLLWIVERNPHPSNVIDGDVERAKTILERADEAMAKAEQMIEEVEIYNSIVEEVEDARNGFDGVEYGTLGEAVRGQAERLKEILGGSTYNAFSPRSPHVSGSKSVLEVVGNNTFKITPSQEGASVSTPVVFSLEVPIDDALTGKLIYVSGAVETGAGNVRCDIGALNGTTFTSIQVFTSISGAFNLTYQMTAQNITAHAGKVLAVRFYGAVSATVTTSSVTTFKDVMVTIGDPVTRYAPHVTANDAIARLSIQDGQAYDAEQGRILGDAVEMSAGYIKCASNPVNTGDVRIEKGWQHALVPCTGGDLFTVTAAGGRAARAYAFIDSAGTILGFSGQEVALENVCVKAPNGATHLIINDNSGSVSRYGDTSETYAEWHNDAGRRVFRTGFENYYLGPDTIGRSTSAKPRTKVFNVDKGKTYVIHFNGGDIRRIGFYDANYQDQSKTNGYISYGNDTETVMLKVTDTHPMMAVYYATAETVGGDVYIEEVPLGELANNDMVKRVMQNSYNIAYANAAHPLMMRSYMDNNMNVHPSVKYFPSGLFGHRFWMAYTPYPLKSTYRENPCIAYSEDGYNWTNIAANPLDTPHGGNRNYNSDTHLVYNDKTGLLECWYRFANVVDTSETVYRKTSSDGLTWSAREELHVAPDSLVTTLSPAVIFDGEKYQIWVVNDKQKRIDYYESASGSDWSLIRSLTIEFAFGGKQYNTWHIDVEMIDGGYVLLSMAREAGTTGFDHAHLFIAQSADNDVWSVDGVVIAGRAGGWDSSLYRSCLVEVDGVYRIYYSALNGEVYGIGITESDTLSNFIGAFY